MREHTVTEVKIHYQGLTINIGGCIPKRTAEITYSVCIDSEELEYKSVKLRGVKANSWEWADILFMQELFYYIDEYRGMKLASLLEWKKEQQS